MTPRNSSPGILRTTASGVETGEEMDALRCFCLDSSSFSSISAVFFPIPSSADTAPVVVAFSSGFPPSAAAVGEEALSSDPSAAAANSEVPWGSPERTVTSARGRRISNASNAFWRYRERHFQPIAASRVKSTHGRQKRKKRKANYQTMNQ